MNSYHHLIEISVRVRLRKGDAVGVGAVAAGQHRLDLPRKHRKSDAVRLEAVAARHHKCHELCKKCLGKYNQLTCGLKVRSNTTN